MPFEPRSLIDIPAELRADLDREASAEDRAEVRACIVAMVRAALQGDLAAKRELLASASATLALSIVSHIENMLTSDPDGEELRTMLTGLPGASEVVTYAALQATIVASGDINNSQPDTAEGAARMLRRFDCDLDAAQVIARAIWEDVRDVMGVVRSGACVNRTATKAGSAVYVRHPSKPSQQP